MGTISIRLPGQAYRGKRLRFRCNRWIRVGQAVVTVAGPLVRGVIDRIDDDGVRIAQRATAAHVTFHWSVVFKRRGFMAPMIERWRPVQGAP